MVFTFAIEKIRLFPGSFSIALVLASDTLVREVLKWKYSFRLVPTLEHGNEKAGTVKSVNYF